MIKQLGAITLFTLLSNNVMANNDYIHSFKLEKPIVVTKLVDGKEVRTTYSRIGTKGIQVRHLGLYFHNNNSDSSLLCVVQSYMNKSRSSAKCENKVDSNENYANAKVVISELRSRYGSSNEYKQIEAKISLKEFVKEVPEFDLATVLDAKDGDYVSAEEEVLIEQFLKKVKSDNAAFLNSTVKANKVSDEDKKAQEVIRRIQKSKEVRKILDSINKKRMKNGLNPVDYGYDGPNEPLIDNPHRKGL